MSETFRLIVVAQIAGAFGVKGEARIRSFTADPDACFDYGPLMDETGAVILTPLRHRSLNEGYGVTTKEQRQREEWEAMKGILLHVRRDAMPPPDEDEAYVADLIGCHVEHVDGRLLGQIVDAPNFGAGDLLEIKPASGPVFHLPFTLADIPEVDLAARRVRANPVEDLLPEALQKPENLQRQNSDGGTN